MQINTFTDNIIDLGISFYKNILFPYQHIIRKIMINTLLFFTEAEKQGHYSIEQTDR
jgi:hypothetical protein